ncbi:fatty acid-2 hydroxylase [Stylonychia lemnae]|uniref:Fatty acid 2-hydroxylase n=1 Tax=Stylonychia lemnae TaxID=5949 RepID=A0A078B9R1_STYLE|nr:fatty acid-2 hydroxylase [Stylonychia lemnae]|eukprot:CDW91265.1 fatty acid-2 hydroxylase [Stylonychia lemnae]
MKKTSSDKISTQKIQFKSEATVSQYQEQNPDLKLVIFEGVVYNINEYINLHPGGIDILQNLLGKSIDDAFEEISHSKAARNIFQNLEIIGRMTSNNFTVDLNESDTQDSDQGQQQDKKDCDGLDGYKLKGNAWKPDYSRSLISQLWYDNITHEEYVNFVEEPKILINPRRSVKVFSNDFMEFFVKTPWYHLVIFYFPFIYTYIIESRQDIIQDAIWFSFGIFYWSFLEYLIHRFVFHAEKYWLPYNKAFKVVHFLGHGMHHAFPNEPKATLVPVLLGYILVKAMLDPFIRLLLPDNVEDIFIAGTLFGYVIYDLIHHFIHQSQFNGGYMKTVKLYHMQHHYKSGWAGFGVTHKFWDIVFRTELKF